MVDIPPEASPSEATAATTVAKEEITRKVLVIGDCGVGKTSFVWRCSGGKFLGNNYKPTVGSKTKDVLRLAIMKTIIYVCLIKQQTASSQWFGGKLLRFGLL